MTRIPHSSPPLLPSKSHAAQTAIQSSFLWIALVLPLLPIGHAAFGQALPAAEAAPISTGFELPRTAGTLQYSVGANENISTGYYNNSGVATSTGINGDVAFISASKLDPFSMVFSGGQAWSTSGQPSTTFLNLGLSQVISGKHWNLILSDSVSYLPQTPSTGISGIPGTGDLGVPPINVGEDFGQGVLTPYSTRVGNTTSLNIQRSLTGKTSIQASGSYNVLYFVGSSANGGLNSTGKTGTGGISHRIDARNSINGNYAYTQYNYDSGLPGFISQTASLGYSHQFSPRLGMSLSAGPQWTADTSTRTSPATPNTVNLYASATLNYAAKVGNFALSYSRGTNSGYGVINGALSDSVSFRASRTFAKVWNGAFTSSFTHSTGLVTTGSLATFAPRTFVDSAQLSRALAKSLSIYASYTLEDQANTGSHVTVNTFNGFFQVASFGITYSPTSIHFGTR
jgi:hypothetical protein